MSLSLLFNFSNSMRRKIAIGGIELDATVKEDHNKENEVTDYALEDGSFVTDHVRSLPDTLTIEGEVSDTPVELFGGLAGISSRRSIEAHEQLVRLRNERALVSVVTGLELYSDMEITHLHAWRDQATGRRLQFVCDLKKVRKVSTKLVYIAPERVSEAQSKRAPSTTNAGRQPTNDAQGTTVRAPSVSEQMQGALGQAGREVWE